MVLRARVFGLVTFLVSRYRWLHAHPGSPCLAEGVRLLAGDRFAAPGIKIVGTMARPPMKPLKAVMILMLVAVGTAYGEEQTSRSAPGTIGKSSASLQKAKTSEKASINTPVNQFIKNVTARPCDVAYAKIDFGQDVPPVVIVTGNLENYDKWGLHPWTFFEFKDNQWIQPKTQEFGGEVSNIAGVDFDHTNAGNVYVKKFKKKGILSYNQRFRFGYFTYLDAIDNILKTIQFLKPSEIGMTEEELIKLIDSGKLNIRHRILK